MAIGYRAGRGAGFQGGVAGGIPPHKGGPQARPPIKQERGVRNTLARHAQGRELSMAVKLRWFFFGRQKGRNELTQ